MIAALRCLLLTFVVGLGVQVSGDVAAVAAGQQEHRASVGYAYDATNSSTTPTLNARTCTADAERTAAGLSRPSMASFVPGRAAKAERGLRRGTDEVLCGLPKEGKQPHVRTVGSDDELQSVYDDLAAGGKEVDVPGYPGKWAERPDGTRVGIRGGSKSGGATIDIRRPDGSIQKGPHRMTTQRRLLEDLVARGVDDRVYDAEVLDIASRHGIEHPSDRRTVAIGLVAEALVGGLMEAGTVSDDGFAAWPCSVAEAVERVAANWLSRADPLAMPGEIVWLNNTARGCALGEAVLDREHE